jgi:hypothetical protein
MKANLSMSKNLSHVHKLKRHTYKTGAKTYFCVLPDCSYKTSVEFSLGKRTLCWRCGEEFIINEYTMRLAKPHCNKCHKRKDSHDAIIVETSESLRARLTQETSVANDEDRDI